MNGVIKYAVIRVETRRDPEVSYEHLLSESLITGFTDIREAENWRQKYIINNGNEDPDNIQVISYRYQ